ncbi:Uncharacterised protein [uncultured Roseburia sp.]|uniref:DUF5666 domain-containing protein n=1 Tax=Brotonthovivens ammoniilytica TaxID=2981725 RepID=A0ABT2TLI6_9FIRM|nr:hypothetical protein [Brotonthovivens ammoniilytica]MCU6762512.1 hypothetical protein [Brotonthovivens ammoniilytica]SCI74316.1 Uncharacterised protein [uncultured Roseburia sp.]
MKKEDELIKKAVQRGMPDREKILNYCIHSLELEQKEMQSMRRRKLNPRKLIVLGCVVVGVLAGSTICYAATGKTPLENVRVLVNGKEADVTTYLGTDDTIRYDFKDGGSVEVKNTGGSKYKENIKITDNKTEQSVEAEIK